MKKFEFAVPTDVLFGIGQEEQLAEWLKPLGKKILMTYGGGSIKRTSIYEKIKRILKE